MPRNFAYLALAAAIATLSACGDGHDGHDGANGLTALINLAAEPAGTHCAEGGTKVDAGPDTNANGVLDDDEITQTTYVCTGATGAAGLIGATGPVGATGSSGQDGLNTLMLLSSETAGANCSFGGTRI